MKTLLGMAPWAVVLLVVAAAIWFLSERNPAAGRWVLAGVLVAHGVVHLLYLVPQPATATAGGSGWPFDLSQGWLAGPGRLDPTVVRALAMGLIAAVVIGFGLSGIATVGGPMPAAWWPVLVTASAVLSLALLVLCFAPGLLLGVGLDLALVWLALVSSWRPLLT